MPLIFVLPLIAGLAGMFTGSQIENKINNPTQPVTAQQPDKMPWYVTMAIIVVLSFIAIIVVKRIVNKTLK